MIKGSTAVYGILGDPVEHSLSPVFQNLAFKHLGINAVYVAFHVGKDRLRDAISGLKALRVRGVNITIPHKEEVLNFADLLSLEVREIGAANTLKFSDAVEAYNTDWLGFKRSLEDITDPKGKKALLLGAGGSSRAVAYALRRLEVETFVWNRTRSKAERLAERFGLKVINRPEEVVGEVDIVINTTSVGLKDGDGEIFDYSLISARQVVLDIIYRDTPLIKRAKTVGAKAVNGFPMLLYQGVESFKIWTGCEPPVNLLKEALIPFGYPTEC